MGGVSFWKILRVLTTNICNYDCTFCHNEGQEKVYKKNAFLQFETFKAVLESLKGSGLKEVQFSGGEPFINPDTIEMISWVHQTTDYDLGCATNTQFFDEKIINKLSETRVRLNIQFPALDKHRFLEITKSSGFDRLQSNIQKLKDARVKFSLNYVLQKDNIHEVKAIIEYSLNNQIPLKILPIIDKEDDSFWKSNKFAIEYLNSIAVDTQDMKNGAVIWKIKGGENSIVQIKYIHAPCFDRDFSACKNYAEVRLCPDLTIKPCLIDDKYNFQININNDNPETIKQCFQTAWKTFTAC